MKKRVTAAVMVLLLLAACGKEDVKEQESTADRVRDEATPAPAETDNGEDGNDGNNVTGEKTELKLNVVTNKLTSESMVTPDDGDPFPIGYVQYQEIELADECKAAYPKLSEALDSYNSENEESAMRTLAGMVRDVLNDPYSADYMYSSDDHSENTDVVRADDKVLSLGLDYYDWYNGAHPVTYYGGVTFDVATGEQIPLSDVVTDINALPQIICDNLESVSDDYEFTDEDYEEMLPKIEQYVADGMIAWTISDTEMQISFDAYALQYYAFGPIFADLEYSKYPDLLVPEYRPDGGSSALTGRVVQTDGKDEKYSDDEIREIWEQYSDGSEIFSDRYVTTPDWGSAYVADDSEEKLSDVPFELKQIKKEDMMFADSWANEKGLVLPGFYRDSEGRYSEDGYTFEFLNDADNGTIAVTYYDDMALTRGYRFDLSSFLYTPDPGNEFTTMYIRYAKILDDTLYVNVAHRTYSADQPDTAYMLAIDIQTGQLRWKSENLVANSDNFLIYKDAIICGYGFTKEDDYFYILSRYTGKILKKTKVKTSPDYFAIDDGKLYVICYDTIYTYELK